MPPIITLVSKTVAVNAATSAANHIIDKYVKGTVKEPKIGSILYTGLVLDSIEHSGVYIGNGHIIELNSTGDIKTVSYKEFISGGTGQNIYVSCNGTTPVGSSLIARNAIRFMQEISSYEYSLLNNNCHIFTSACIIDEFDSSYRLLRSLKKLARDNLNCDNWRVWKSPQSLGLKEKDLESRLENINTSLSKLRKQSGVIQKDNEHIMELVQKHSDTNPAFSILWPWEDLDEKTEKFDKKFRELENSLDVLNAKMEDLIDEFSHLEDEKAHIEAVLK